MAGDSSLADQCVMLEPYSRHGDSALDVLILSLCLVCNMCFQVQAVRPDSSKLLTTKGPLRRSSPSWQLNISAISMAYESRALKGTIAHPVNLDTNALLRAYLRPFKA